MIDERVMSILNMFRENACTPQTVHRDCREIVVLAYFKVGMIEFNRVCKS